MSDKAIQKHYQMLSSLKPGLDFYGIEIVGKGYREENKIRNVLEKLCKELDSQIDNLNNAESIIEDTGQ